VLIDSLEPIHALFNHGGARKVLLLLRVPLALALVCLAIFLAEPGWFLPGLIVSAFGTLLQSWCFASLHKQKTLAVHGPYKIVRNPMYLARYFLILGAVLVTGQVWAIVTFTILYYFYMVNRVKREEQKLQKIFGDEYVEYCHRVHRFFPVTSCPGGTFFFFSKDCFFRNNGYWMPLATIAFYVVCWLHLTYCLSHY